MKRQILTCFLAGSLGIGGFAAVVCGVYLFDTYPNAKYWALAALMSMFIAYLLYPFAEKIINYFYKSNP